MRNSVRNHNWRNGRLSASAPWALLVALLCPGAWAQDQEFRITSEDMIAIRADQAWEDSKPNTVNFEGHFEMRVHDWLVQADRAILQGKLDDPVRLVLQGSPARMELSHTVNGRTEQVLGEAQEIVYDREMELIYLKGAARLGQGDNVLKSDSVRYDIRENRFQAEGDSGVQLEVTTEN